MKTVVFVSRATLRGIAQIFLQENILSGILLLVGIAYGSVLIASSTLLAAFIGTSTAYLLNFDREMIEKGLFGFSAALVGAAVFVFLAPVLTSWVLVAFGAIAAALLQFFFLKRKITVFTLPFVLVTWFFVLVVPQLAPDLWQNSLATTVSNHLFLFPLKAFGQVIFQDSIATGLLFFFALLISSPVAALYGISAAIISGLIVYACGIPLADIENGLWSYNAVLCAMVFAGRSLDKMIWVLMSVTIAITVQCVMQQLQWMVLTFPFVAACMLTLFVRKKVSAYSCSR